MFSGLSFGQKNLKFKELNAENKKNLIFHLIARRAFPKGSPLLCNTMLSFKSIKCLLTDYLNKVNYHTSFLSNLSNLECFLMHGPITIIACFNAFK